MIGLDGIFDALTVLNWLLACIVGGLVAWYVVRRVR